MSTATNPDADAEFVIFGSRLNNGSVGYANDNGDFVPFDRARIWTVYEAAMTRARALAESIRQTVYVAPLLFGIPDLEVMETLSPDRA
ncbi:MULTISPECIES: hypothetical protein [unclassified Brevundimonas]|uniref:hypothetical protein n=1 Tax=unclassified Brevundimonas TaxID=2622653 RepID=UPI0025C508E0|nr:MULTISPECIES: hypothetical protein [unclassified Brevundimonas]